MAPKVAQMAVLAVGEAATDREWGFLAGKVPLAAPLAGTVWEVESQEVAL